MFLATHAAIGSLLAVGCRFRHAYTAFLVGWVSHYLADAYPHDDGVIGVWIGDGDAVLRMAFVASIEIVLVGAFVAALIVSRRDCWKALSPAALGACLPDALRWPEMLVHQTLFGPLKECHSFFHGLGEGLLPILPLDWQIVLALLAWSACAVVVNWARFFGRVQLIRSASRA